MKKLHDIVAEFPGVLAIHPKIPSHEVGRHQHDEHEFFLPLQGEIEIGYGEEVVKAGPGRMLYVPPDLDHSFSSSSHGSGERVIWLIDQKTWRHHVQGDFSPCSFPTNSLAKELIFFLLIHRKIDGAKYFVSALIESLSESLKSSEFERKNLSSDHIAGKVTDTRVKQSIEIMQSCLGDVSVSEIARSSGMSARNFNRLFLRETGLTPKDYLIYRRVERAKTLLKETKMTVTDISLEVGYHSLSKFIATFKRFSGSLPSDYRTVESKK